MEDIKESKELKSRISDAAANREIFALKVRVISARIKQLKHEEAIKLCGSSPKIPVGVDPVTFRTILDHIYERTESALIGDKSSVLGKKMEKQINSVIKANPKLKTYMKQVV